MGNTFPELALNGRADVIVADEQPAAAPRPLILNNVPGIVDGLAMITASETCDILDLEGTLWFAIYGDPVFDAILFYTWVAVA